MTTLELFGVLARYNAWMNERLMEICRNIPDEERREDRGAFFRSIHGTCNHLLLADRLWLGRFKRRPYRIKSLDQELYDDFDELAAERSATDEEILEWAEDLDAEALERTIRYTAVADGAERSLPYGFAVLHFFNHQTHHRGQLTTLMKQAGWDPGVTDLLWLPKGAEGG
jgi:uncharacterized damage-inducible protein DinB